MPGMAGEEFDAAYFRAAKHFGEYFNNDGESTRWARAFTSH
jgi:hypothetical protein